MQCFPMSSVEYQLLIYRTDIIKKQIMNWEMGDFF